MNFFILILFSCALFSVSKGESIRDVRDVFQGLYFNDPASRSLYEYLDLSIDPCDNFYQFACGEWIKTQKWKYKDYISFNIKNRNVNFNKFFKGKNFFVFIYLLLEFEEGKYNRESKAINNIYNLRDKCNRLPNVEIGKCKKEVLDFGTYAVSALFLKKNEIKSEQNGDYALIEDMIERIKFELELLIDDKRDMFDEETRNYFLHKLKTMKFQKEYDLYEFSNIDQMENCYQNIGKIVFNLTSIKDALNYIRQVKNYRPMEDHRFGFCNGEFFHPQKLVDSYVYGNAKYNNGQNYFSINSDYLNEPSFSINFPLSLNYGYLGTAIAHEMLHAFDRKNYNRTFEGDNIINFNVTQMSVENFEEKSKCFVKQYDMQKESITNKNINGLQTLNENIADNGGLKIAHRAYSRYLFTTADNDTIVRGFEKFTKIQLFFISFGRKRCEYRSKDSLENSIRKSVHTPGEIRTNVALSNYKPFSEAFNCPLNSKMNPENKCELWKNQKQNQ
uniref:Peptidase_M13 domain-containing protein n=1 Tax=Strongyloides papillosus TaxID=174720 RepID=A0A0N5C273_STREA